MFMTKLSTNLLVIWRVTGYCAIGRRTIAQWAGSAESAAVPFGRTSPGLGRPGTSGSNARLGQLAAWIALATVDDVGEPLVIANMRQP
jgi:hypothetical protein